MIKVFAWAGGVLAAVVTATGVYVAFRYRPDATGFASAMAQLHAWSSIGLAVVAVVGLAALVWEWRPDRLHGITAFAVIAVVAVVLVVEYVLGRGLAWDQLALWAVTVGTDLRGVFVSSQVKFVLIDGREVGRDDYLRVAWAHVVVLPVVIAGGIGFVVIWTRRFARPEARPARPPSDDG